MAVPRTAETTANEWAIGRGCTDRSVQENRDLSKSRFLGQNGDGKNTGRDERMLVRFGLVPVRLST